MGAVKGSGAESTGSESIKQKKMKRGKRTENRDDLCILLLLARHDRISTRPIV